MQIYRGFTILGSQIARTSVAVGNLLCLIYLKIFDST